MLEFELFLEWSLLSEFYFIYSIYDTFPAE